MSEIFSARELSYQKEIKRLKTDKSVMRNAYKDLRRENEEWKREARRLNILVGRCNCLTMKEYEATLEELKEQSE